MSGNERNSDLTTSQINQSEAGPDIVQIDSSFFKKGEQIEASKTASAAEENGTGDHERKNHQTLNPAIQALDRLISKSPSPRHPVNVVTPLKNEKIDASTKSDSAFKLESLEQSVLEMELSKLHDLLVKQEKVSQEKISDYETHLTKLTGQTCLLHDQLKQAEEREKALAKKVNDQNQSQLQLSIVMQEYEKLISKLTAEIETEKRQSKEQIESLTTEKDSALVHLANVEAAFTDVHQKYEKCKKVIEDYKKNETKMKAVLNDQMETLKLKEKQLETAHKEVDRIKQSHDMEMTRLRALLRKTELKVISVQESLEQKIKENQELTRICDDLIEGKVPGN